MKYFAQANDEQLPLFIAHPPIELDRPRDADRQAEDRSLCRGAFDVDRDCSARDIVS